MAGRATALLHLPAPQATGEAHLIALVYEGPEPGPDNQPHLSPDDEDEEADDFAPEEVTPRYFLLEAALGRSPDEAGTPTLLGELLGEQHRHHAPGPPAGRPDTAGRFLQALAELLGPLPDAVPFMRVVRG